MKANVCNEAMCSCSCGLGFVLAADRDHVTLCECVCVCVTVRERVCRGGTETERESVYGGSSLVSYGI